MRQASVWLDSWENLLRKQGSPVLEFHQVESLTCELLSAANIWTLALNRKRELSRVGLRSGDILADVSSGKELIVNLVASAMGGWIYWPIKKADVEKFQAPQESITRNIFLFSGQSVQKVNRNDIDLSFLGADDVLILSTSGTSGAPRIVSYTGEILLQQIYNINMGLGCEPESGRLIVLPFHHCFGLILDLLAGLFQRQSLHICNQSMFHPEKILNIINSSQIQYLSLVPRMVDILGTYLEKNSQEGAALKNLQIHCGGALVSESLRKKIEPWVIEFVEGYGSTEMAGGVLLRGTPNGCEIKLESVENKKMELFELYLKGPTLGNFSQRDKALDSEGYFKSGDLVQVTPTGKIKVVGRVGTVIKSSDGTWVDFARIEIQLKNRFGFSRVYIDSADGQVQVVVAGSSVNENLVSDFIERYYGISVQLIDVPLDESIDKILLASSRKSVTEAVAAWYREKKCA